jgi:CubicO group peptidase (beta-lactamase class C family)
MRHVKPAPYRGRIALTGALALLLIAYAAGQASNPAPTPDYSAIISDFRASLPKLMREQKVPGLALAVVDDRETLWMEGFGYTADDHKLAVTPDTLFSIQSASKNFTAAAVLVAVQDGLLDLDTPITKYLPGFTVNSRFEAHPERKITLRMLLSHRAGFTHEAPVGNCCDGDSTSFEQHVRSISQTWLRFPVGQRYSYSNLGVDLAGYILQVKSGMPFHRYAKQKLLDPIGMAASSFDMDLIRRSAQRAVGHDSIPPPVEVPMIPAGGLYTNAREWARYVQFHLRGGKIDGAPLIRGNLLRQMYEIPSPLPHQSSGYGLGLGIGKFGTTRLNHSGSGFGFASVMTWYPDYGLGIVLLTNSDGHSLYSTLPGKILDRFIVAKLGRAPGKVAQSTDPAQKEYELSPERQRTLAGRYLYNRGGFMTMSFKEGRLGNPVGETFVPFHWIAEDEGFLLVNAVQTFYRFARKQDGTPSHFVRLNDGEVYDYNGGDDDPPGPNKPDWDRHLGKYQYKAFGQPAGTFEVRKQNGNLYFHYWKLVEFQPGLFFTCHGEAVDLRGAQPTVANIKLEKIKTP